MDTFGTLLTIIVAAAAFAPEQLGAWIAKVRAGYRRQASDPSP